jgi:hypothetical protein
MVRLVAGMDMMCGRAQTQLLYLNCASYVTIVLLFRLNVPFKSPVRSEIILKIFISRVIHTRREKCEYHKV